MKLKKQNIFILALFAVYFLILAWLVLFKLQFFIPVMEEGGVINLIPFMGSLDENGVFQFSEVRNNILAFIPFGIYICMLKWERPFWKKALCIAAVSLAFETAQFAFMIGRADVTDVISNTIGGIIGIGVYALLLRLLKGRTNQVLSILAAVITALILVSIALLLGTNRWIRIQ